MLRPENRQGHRPDLETGDTIWEVKCRTWTTPGTAGDKVIGVPWKYAAAPRLYGKPLRIVLCGYQEYEARHNFRIWDPSPEQQALWDAIKSLDIEYVPFTSLLDASFFCALLFNIR